MTDEHAMREIARHVVREEMSRSDPALKELIRNTLREELGADYAAVLNRVRLRNSDSDTVRSSVLTKVTGTLIQGLVYGGIVLLGLELAGRTPT